MSRRQVPYIEAGKEGTPGSRAGNQEAEPGDSRLNVVSDTDQCLAA